MPQRKGEDPRKDKLGRHSDLTAEGVVQPTREQGGLPVRPGWSWSGCWEGNWPSSRLHVGEQGAGEQ